MQFGTWEIIIIFFFSMKFFFLPISNLELKPFSMQKVWFFLMMSHSFMSHICVWVNYNCYWLKGAYDRFYTQNVSNVCEFTEADDSFSEAYDSLSREPITITSRSTLEWFWLVFIKKIRLIYLIRSLLIGPEKGDRQSESLSKR